MYERIRVAALSIKPQKWNKEFNAKKLEHYFIRAANTGVDLVLAPEGFLEGYLVNEIIRDRSLEQKIFDLAEPIDGPYIQKFTKLAAMFNVAICFGFAERKNDGIYNTAIIINQNGDISGTYNKTQFAEGYNKKWRFNRIGKKIRTINTPFGRAGILICNDRSNPRIARTLYMDGAQFFLIPTYGNRGKTQNVSVLARARENGIPIVQANVGLALIIDKGEIIAYSRKMDSILYGEINIPRTPSKTLSSHLEQQYLIEQKEKMHNIFLKSLHEKRES